ncbi:hypothetical protein I7I50_08811 [Histoplasma capsulatum G186AR]|uniref:Uncharacterized protein n=1 Tax=Ajellomyces capsulatus TaxID=5037 RepID=A0A8H7YQN0_AJECA|nr:hypothetical protein I7I52_06325 [Histoplasma capsulatum]QSS73880.1 hypothetical protein I7I50_08811 [Histoplasma capsulatum G186AR]
MHRINALKSAKEKISEGLFTGPLAWASGLLHIGFPACFPIIADPGGMYAESSKSPSCTRSMRIPSFRACQSTKKLSALISTRSK